MKLRLNHPSIRRLAPSLAAKLLNLSFRTCRRELVAPAATRTLLDSGQAVIYSTWHCHLLYPIYFFSQRYLDPVVMASPSRDGELVAQMCRDLGYIVVHGSRRKGGAQAVKTMAGYLRRGHSTGVVADGSRGPAGVAQKGVVFLAREAQAPLVPMVVAASRKVTFNTWDRFELPLPFSRLALLAGEPLLVPPEARGRALEAFRLELEHRLNELFLRSRHYFPR